MELCPQAPHRKDSLPCSIPWAQVPCLCRLLGLLCAETHARQSQAEGRVSWCAGAVGSQDSRLGERGGSVCLTLCPAQVCVEGRLYLEFMFDDMMRIKTWHFSIRQHRELIPRSILAMHVSTVLPSARLGC